MERPNPRLGVKQSICQWVIQANLHWYHNSFAFKNQSDLLRNSNGKSSLAFIILVNCLRSEWVNVPVRYGCYKSQKTHQEYYYANWWPIIWTSWQVG